MAHDLREEIERLQRSMDNLLEYLPYLPVTEPISGEITTLEDWMEFIERQANDDEYDDL